MGLHHLDKLMDYSIENVNNSPVILYGSFEGEVLFLEMSLTAYAFQNVITSGTFEFLGFRQRLTNSNFTGKQSWPIRLPNGVTTSRWWPQVISLEYDSTTALFTFTLDDMTYLQLRINGDFVIRYLQDTCKLLPVTQCLQEGRLFHLLLLLQW